MHPELHRTAYAPSKAKKPKIVHAMRSIYVTSLLPQQSRPHPLNVTCISKIEKGKEESLVLPAFTNLLVLRREDGT